MGLAPYILSWRALTGLIPEHPAWSARTSSRVGLTSVMSRMSLATTCLSIFGSTSTV